MRERITKEWDVSKRQRGPTARGEQRDTQPGDLIGANGKTYRCASMSQTGSIVSADFEEVYKS